MTVKPARLQWRSEEYSEPFFDDKFSVIINMTRKELILASMATCCGHTYTPVQLQKLLFLLDERASADLGGPHFDFKPYHYGPFDKAVYDELDILEQQGLVEVIREPHLKVRKYRLRPGGAEQGVQELEKLDPKTKDFVHKLSEFVRNASFPQLVSAVYEAYPAMRVNSVFVG
jgi:hypothetical protein